jgi:hypothetical protein
VENSLVSDIISVADFFLPSTLCPWVKNPQEGDTSPPEKSQVQRKYRRKKALPRMTKFAEFMAASLL